MEPPSLAAGPLCPIPPHSWSWLFCPVVSHAAYLIAPWLCHPPPLASFCYSVFLPLGCLSPLAPDGQVSSVTGSIIRVHSFISCYLSWLQLIIHGLYVQCQEGSTSVHHHLSRTEHSTHHRQEAQQTLNECMYHITTGPPEAI